MKRDDSFHEYVMNEVFREIIGISSRAMFGGWGIYQNGYFFALIDDGRLYFKVDETNKADYELEGSEPFVYKGKDGKKMTMNYYEVPADVLENYEKIAMWVDKAVEVAVKAKK
jgi:DNA transformation protein